MNGKKIASSQVHAPRADRSRNCLRVDHVLSRSPLSKLAFSASEQCEQGDRTQCLGHAFRYDNRIASATECPVVPSTKAMCCRTQGEQHVHLPRSGAGRAPGQDGDGDGHDDPDQRGGSAGAHHARGPAPRLRLPAPQRRQVRNDVGTVCSYGASRCILPRTDAKDMLSTS